MIQGLVHEVRSIVDAAILQTEVRRQSNGEGMAQKIIAALPNKIRQVAREGGWNVGICLPCEREGRWRSHGHSASKIIATWCEENGFVYEERSIVKANNIHGKWVADLSAWQWGDEYDFSQTSSQPRCVFHHVRISW